MMTHTLIYVADPMCSWCWGFSPVLEEMTHRYHDRVSFQLVMGGLRPGNTERFDESRRAYILQHWHAVHKRTGQPFNFEFQMGPTFTYDTEPASRATVVTRQLVPGQEWVFLKRVQEAFYVQNFDQARQLGVSGFPTLLGRQGQSVSTLMHGYQDLETLTPVIEQFIQKVE
jgi:putative protein-disulfide isomerase